MHRSKSIDEMPVHVYCHLHRLRITQQWPLQGMTKAVHGMPGAAARTGLRNT
ncbi:MAG TPA: hypothetical protein VGK56_05615 [Anaerolineales bacterium]